MCGRGGSSAGSDMDAAGRGEVAQSKGSPPCGRDQPASARGEGGSGRAPAVGQRGESAVGGRGCAFRGGRTATGPTEQEQTGQDQAAHRSLRKRQQGFGRDVGSGIGEAGYAFAVYLYQSWFRDEIGSRAGGGGWRRPGADGRQSRFGGPGECGGPDGGRRCYGGADSCVGATVAATSRNGEGADGSAGSGSGSRFGSATGPEAFDRG